MFFFVTPLIKKKTLCRNEFKNYRPISNLSFLSKILEKIVAKRLNEHIEEQLLSNHVQSAYKRFHSTETALLKIHNDIICNMDNGKVTALTLLDLSAAFDTIDHSTLLERLYGNFGISGTVFQWFKSYISNRQQRVHIGRVHTTLFRTGRDRSRPVRAQLPVSTRGQLERSFRILETTSRHGTTGRDRSRSVAPCQIYRVDARVGATDLSANQPLLAHAFLIYFFPF